VPLQSARPFTLAIGTTTGCGEITNGFNLG